MLRMLYVLPLYVLAGCLADPPFTCPSENQACPPGHSCVAGQCVSDAAMDLSMPTVQDMSAEGDQAGPLADMSGQPAKVAGCVGLGFQVGQAFACVGPFEPTKTKASQLCAAGFALCTSATKVDVVACKLLPSFFLADVLLSRYTIDPPTSGVCDLPPAVGQSRQFAGCGGRSVVSLTAQCHGFSQAADCVSEGPTFVCGGNKLDAVADTRMGDGVLCC